jgi:DNA end-binding protein Ku
MARPYWSGNLQISLVSFGIKLFPATEAKSEIRFHQIDRKSGERVRHQKVSAGGDGPVENSDIVKGFEYRKGQYVTIEPEDIANLRIPSRHSLEVVQFVDEDEISPAYFEKPYFVTPEDASAAEAFAVVRRALQETKKVALGKIAFGGREHLVAISAPPEGEEGEEKERGMMAYTMRYAEELRKPEAYFDDIKHVTVEDDQLSLAKELIKRKTAKFAPDKFKDEYEAALRAMVEARINNEPIADEEPKKQPGRVVNLMDALRRSVDGDASSTKTKPPAKAVAHKKGLTLVKGEKSDSKPAATVSSAKSQPRPKRKTA